MTLQVLAVAYSSSEAFSVTHRSFRPLPIPEVKQTKG